MVLSVGLQVFGQLPDPARQQRDLHIGATGVLAVQLELLDIQRFRVLSHFESAYCRPSRRNRKAEPELEGAFSMHQRAAPSAPSPEQNERADDRHDESGGMKG